MIKSVLFIVDLEGCAGVYNIGSEDIKLMNEQVDFILKSIEENTSYSLTVLDFHDSGTNLTPLTVKHSNVKFIKHIWNFNDTEKYDVAFLIGFHAPGGSQGGLSHTFRNDIKQIKLGKSVVGEAEIVCNWLYGLNIPVLLINGDEYFCKTTSLDIPKIELPKNGVDASEEFRKKYYEQLSVAILNSLKKPISAIKYRKEKVYVELCYNYQKIYFPRCHFRLIKDKIVFDDTAHFVNCLQELCVILNSSISITSARLDRLIKYVRFHYSKEQIDAIKDDRFSRILNNVDSWDINTSDEQYILKILKRLDKKQSKSLSIEKRS